MKRAKGFDLKFARDFAIKYSGKFAAIVNEKVVATGKSRSEVFLKAEKIAPATAKIGVFYFPTKKEMLTAL